MSNRHHSERPRVELERLRASGVRLVAIRAPDGSPPECLMADETLYSVERAQRETPLPHSRACTCFYAPRRLEEEGLAPEMAHALGATTVWAHQHAAGARKRGTPRLTPPHTRGSGGAEAG